jgi:small subunit ribosomal protein S17e
MGRIRGKFIKNISKKLVEQYPDKFSNKFEDNKKVLDELKIIGDKPIRNKIAGYIVVVVKKKKIK